MGRKSFALALVLGLAAVSLAACAPAADSGDDEQSVTESETSPETTPSDPLETELEWPPGDGDPLNEWPLTIPKPPGTPLEGLDTPAQYTVPADRDTYLEYLREIRELRDSQEMSSTGQEIDGAVFDIGAYRLVVEFTEQDGGQITVVLTA